MRLRKFHHVEDESRRPLAALMQDTECRIIPFGDALNSHLAFEHGIGVIQNRVNGMRGVSVARQFEERCARAEPSFKLFSGRHP